MENVEMLKINGFEIIVDEYATRAEGRVKLASLPVMEPKSFDTTGMSFPFHCPLILSPFLSLQYFYPILNIARLRRAPPPHPRPPFRPNGSLLQGTQSLRHACMQAEHHDRRTAQ
jgi:hypothetical protein